MPSPTTDTADTGTPTATGGPRHRSVGPDTTAGRPWSPTATLVALGGAWAVTVGAYLSHTAVIIPLLVVFLTASLLRGGRSLLDRIMLALGLLLGAVCAGGLVLSVWPWGLHPVPVAGLTFTALIGFAALTRRRPTLPRPTLGDGLSVAAALGTAALVAFPLIRLDPVMRLGMATAGEDLSRHVTLFDTIRHVDGYLFLHWQQATDAVFTGMITYPQGSHLLYGLLDGFLRSSASEYGTGLAALDHYLIFAVLGFAMLTLTMTWAAQWLAGPVLTLNRRLVLVGVVTVVLLGGELFTLMVLGYPSEVVGLTAAVLLLTLLARPPARTGQTLVLVASLLVAVGFVYYLFLPAVVVAVLVWLVRVRARVRRHRLALLGVLVALALSVVPALIGVTAGAQGEQLQVPAAAPAGDVLVMFAAVVVAGLLAAGARASGTWRSYAWSLGVVGLACVGLYAVQVVLAGGRPDGGFYYTNKMLHLALAVLAVGLGALLYHLPRPAPPRLRTWSPRTAVPAVLLVVAAAASIGMVFRDAPYRQVADTTWVRAWATGKVANGSIAAVVLEEYQTSTAPPGTVTVMMNDSIEESYLQTVFLSALQRTSGILGPGMYIPEPITAPNRTEHMIANIDAPVLIVAQTPDALREAERIADVLSDQDVQVRSALR